MTSVEITMNYLFPFLTFCLFISNFASAAQDETEETESNQVPDFVEEQESFGWIHFTTLLYLIFTNNNFLLFRRRTRI